MADNWVPYAQENKLVLILPQANECFDTSIGKMNNAEATYPNTFYRTKTGFQNRFMMKLIEIA